MSDIARRAEVSRLTVSAVLNNRYRAVGISEATAERVRDVARELHYHRNQLALAVRTGRNRLIGCMHNAVASDWGGRILQGMLHEAAEREYRLSVEAATGGFAGEMNTLRRFLEQRVEGIACCNMNPGPEQIAQYRSEIEPYHPILVCTNCSLGLSPYRVDSDDLLGCRLAVEHLWALGHRRIAWLGGDPLTATGELRRRGFVAAMRGGGLALPNAWLAVASWRTADAETAAARLLALSPARRPTAIACATDDMAAVTVRAARRLGLDVPGDLSVIGFANLALSHTCDPPLTTVVQPHYQMGRRVLAMAVELVALRQAGGAMPDARQDCLPVELAVRGSTGPAPARRGRGGQGQ